MGYEIEKLMLRNFFPRFAETAYEELNRSWRHIKKINTWGTIGKLIELNWFAEAKSSFVVLRKSRYHDLLVGIYECSLMLLSDWERAVPLLMELTKQLKHIGISKEMIHLLSQTYFGTLQDLDPSVDERTTAIWKLLLDVAFSMISEGMSIPTKVNLHADDSVSNMMLSVKLLVMNEFRKNSISFYGQNEINFVSCVEAFAAKVNSVPAVSERAI